MRKLIEQKQKPLINCDNPKCDYTFRCYSTNEEYLLQFVNKPCPKCGQPLLTAQDYLLHQKVMKFVNFINFWSSWITIFYSRKAKRKSVSMHIHDGVNINKKGY